MLEVVNLTSLAHMTFAAIDADEQMAEVVVAKGSYTLDTHSTGTTDTSLVPTLFNEGTSLFVSDEYFGALNKSSVRTESDLAPYKPRCDLIVIGSAHSPTGKPVKEVKVGVTIERAGKTVHSHSLCVYGERNLARRDALDRSAAKIVWLATVGLVKAPDWYLTEPQPFLVCPLRYELAYGGEMRVTAADEFAQRIDAINLLGEEAREKHPDGAEAPIAHEVCLWNPVGRGFVKVWHAKATRNIRYPAPRIEAVAAPFTQETFDELIRGQFGCGDVPALEPQGFGVITKAWRPRLKLAGTYDEAWLESRWPNPPPDYDMAYWNGTHRAMQCPHLSGDEIVTLTNLLAYGAPGNRLADPATTVASFRVPAVDLALRLELDSERTLYGRMPIDTLTVDLEKMVLHVVWRIRVPAGSQVKNTCLVSLADLRTRETAQTELVTPV